MRVRVGWVGGGRLILFVSTRSFGANVAPDGKLNSVALNFGVGAVFREKHAINSMTATRNVIYL